MEGSGKNSIRGRGKKWKNQLILPIVPYRCEGGGGKEKGRLFEEVKELGR